MDKAQDKSKINTLYICSFLIAMLVCIFSIITANRLFDYTQEIAMSNSRDTLINKESATLGSIAAGVKMVNASGVVAVILLVLCIWLLYSDHTKKKSLVSNKAFYQDELLRQVEDLNRTIHHITAEGNTEKFALTGRMAQGIAHEVKNPLTSIKLAVTQIREKGIADENLLYLLSMIERSSEKINQLILDLLTSTKPEDIEEGKIDMNTLMDHVLEMVRDRITLTGIKIVKNYRADDCDVKIDVERIKIALLNIITNAIESMQPSQGVLTLETKKENGHCYFVIKDNGYGIEEAYINRLFEPYFTMKDNGTGLGLTLTQNIVFMHRGNISVDSRVNEGTTFEVRLPQVD